MNDDKVVSIGGRKRNNKSENPHKTNENTGSSFEPVYCSFCHRPNTEVVKMVQGPGVNICSECTMVAVQYLILEDKLPSGEAQTILDLFWQKI